MSNLVYEELPQSNLNKLDLKDKYYTGEITFVRFISCSKLVRSYLVWSSQIMEHDMLLNRRIVILISRESRHNMRGGWTCQCIYILIFMIQGSVMLYRSGNI